MFKPWAKGQQQGVVCRKCALRLPQVKVTGEICSPDGDADADFVLPRLTDMVNVKYVKRVQKEHAAARPSGHRLQGGLWKNSKGEVWVPADARQLQHLLYAVAHQGPSGHRGRETTMRHLRGRFHWKKNCRHVQVHHWHS